MPVTVHNGSLGRSLGEAPLFAFDDRSIPFREGLELHLISSKASPFKDNPVVVDLGLPGAPDASAVHYRGTVLRIGDELWMYYNGVDDRAGPGRSSTGGTQRLCLATSKDGLNWTKPALGLVEWNGSRDNNLLALPPGHGGQLVLHEPDDPDPSRRFKMVAGSTLYSADGLTWTAGPGPREGEGRKVFFETGGLIHWGDLYHLVGQSGTGYRHARNRARRLLVMISPDLEHWFDITALGFDRSSHDVSPADESRMHNLNEIHLGAGLHDRGTVILGVYGMMHANLLGDFHRAQIDLGLVLSHDGIHFQEPIPGFRLVPAGNTGWHEELIGLFQGQGMHAIGNETFYWYASTHEPGRVRVARWGRDRLGYLQPFLPPRGQRGPFELATCDLSVAGRVALHVNVEMLEPPTMRHAPRDVPRREMRFEVLGPDLRPIPGFAMADCTPVEASSFDHHVRWAGGQHLPAERGKLRVRASFDGHRPEDVRFYCFYLRDDR